MLNVFTVDIATHAPPPPIPQPEMIVSNYDNFNYVKVTNSLTNLLETIKNACDRLKTKFPIISSEYHNFNDKKNMINLVNLLKCALLILFTEFLETIHFHDMILPVLGSQMVYTYQRIFKDNGNILITIFTGANAFLQSTFNVV